MKRKEAPIMHQRAEEEDVAIFVENLLDVQWYTADPQKPYMIKAAANLENGY